MWHFESVVGDKRTKADGTWVEMRGRAGKAALDLPGPERPTVLFLVSEAVPEQPWSCTGADCSFRIFSDRPPVRREAVVASQTPTNDIAHSEREHADLGASNSYIWMNCLGMLNLMRKLKPPKRTSPDAEKGTAVHEAGHLCHLTGQDAVEMIDRVFNGIVIDESMAENLQRYLDKCREYIMPGWECFTEKRFNLKKLNPPEPMFGTADFMALNRAQRRLIIVDYKNGFIFVDPKTPQLKYYVLGVLCALPDDVVVESIEVYIVQPNGRGETYKRADYTVAEIFEWHLELLAKARATQDPNAPRTAGAWCKFCPNAGLCDTQREAAMDGAQLEFVAEPQPGTELVAFNPIELRTLTPEMVDALLLKFTLVEDFMKAIEGVAKTMIDAGIELKNWKMIGGLGHRYWLDQTATANLLTSQAGLTEDQIWEKKLVSPATVEKLLRPMLRERGIKGKAADELLGRVLGALTSRPTTAPRLVRSTDPAPALSARGDEFTAEPMPVQP
jgi:hypothetical protein